MTEDEARDYYCVGQCPYYNKVTGNCDCDNAVPCPHVDELEEVFNENN